LHVIYTALALDHLFFKSNSRYLQFLIPFNDAQLSGSMKQRDAGI